jgi:hypothetical protein
MELGYRPEVEWNVAEFDRFSLEKRLNAIDHALDAGRRRRLAGFGPTPAHTLPRALHCRFGKLQANNSLGAPDEPAGTDWGIEESEVPANHVERST